jgi:hypothetical protein
VAIVSYVALSNIRRGEHLKWQTFILSVCRLHPPQWADNNKELTLKKQLVLSLL